MTTAITIQIAIEVRAALTLSNDDALRVARAIEAGTVDTLGDLASAVRAFLTR